MVKATYTGSINAVQLRPINFIYPSFCASDFQPCHSSAYPVAAQQKCPQPAAQGCPEILLKLGKTIVPVPVGASDATSVEIDAFSSSSSFVDGRGLPLVAERPRFSLGIMDEIDISTIGRSM